LLAATVRSFARMPLGISDRNTMKWRPTCYKMAPNKLKMMPNDVLAVWFQVVYEKAPSGVLTNSPQQQHFVPRWNKNVRKKHKAARQAYI